MADLSITAANVIAAAAAPKRTGIAPRADLGAGDTVVFLGIARSTTTLALRPVNSGVELA